MKLTKKLASLLLALVMALSLATTAFAADKTGSITIDNAVKDQTYTIYEILKLESYNAETIAYSYKATAAWANFINSAAIKDKYVNVDEQGYVTWKPGASAADFAVKAQAYAKANSIANQGSKKADSTTVEFKNLELGYYLVDSSLGTICSLDTTNPDVTILEKNQEPTNEKQVQEDSNNEWGKKNDADIGQLVKFVSEVTLPAGSENVTFHDKMSDGLTLVKGEEGKTGITVYSNARLDEEDIIPDANWTQAVPGKDGCTFEIDLNGCVGDYDKVYVVYYATVNEKAVVGSTGNPNESWLSYGEEGKTTTTPSKTTTYTWELDVFKYTMNSQTETALADAKFVLYKVVAGEKYYAQANATGATYTLTGWTKVEAEATVFTTPADGKFTIKGLDSDTYYLEETVAPAGYNVLKSAIEVKIDNEGKVTYNGTSAGTVKVENKTGTELPSTGGIGTTIFYVVGGLLVVAAGVLLVTRKRMTKSEN